MEYHRRWNVVESILLTVSTLNLEMVRKCLINLKAIQKFRLELICFSLPLLGVIDGYGHRRVAMFSQIRIVHKAN